MQPNLKKFLCFLKENGTYERFLYNFNSDKGKNFRKIYSKRIWFSADILKYAFSWEHTSEGFDYWRRTYKEWLLTLLKSFLEDQSCYLEFLIKSKIKEPFISNVNLVINDDHALSDLLVRLITPKEKREKKWVEDLNEKWIHFINKKDNE